MSTADREDLVHRSLTGATLRGALHTHAAPPVRLRSNESPLPPFPEVQEAMRLALTEAHRYPDIGCFALREAVAAHHGAEPDRVLIGGGCTALLRIAAHVFSGPTTRILYGWPSFAMYRIAAAMARAPTTEVPLDPHHRLDLDAMADAVTPDTSLVVVCNPNNPTGTCAPADALRRFLDRVPPSAVVLLDEAYHAYAAADPAYASALTMGPRPNLIVLRTFSKVYALAGLRVGYAVGDPALLARLRRAQERDTLSHVAQVAAIEALRHPDQVAERVRLNALARADLLQALTDRGLPTIPSATNFLCFRLGHDSQAASDAFAARAVALRPVADGWLRVSVGADNERAAFLAALDEVLAGEGGRTG